MLNVISFSIFCVYVYIWNIIAIAGLLLLYCIYIGIVMLEFIMENRGINHQSDNKSSPHAAECEIDHRVDIAANISNDLLTDIQPFTASEWTESNLITKLLRIVCVCIYCPMAVCRQHRAIVPYIIPRIFPTIWQAPLQIILKLTIPVVDDTLPNNGWNRVLNSVHIITMPAFCLLLTKSKTDDDEKLCVEYCKYNKWPTLFSMRF